MPQYVTYSRIMKKEITRRGFVKLLGNSQLQENLPLQNHLIEVSQVRIIRSETKPRKPKNRSNDTDPIHSRAENQKQKVKCREDEESKN